MLHAATQFSHFVFETMFSETNTIVHIRDFLISFNIPVYRHLIVLYATYCQVNGMFLLLNSLVFSNKNNTYRML